MALWSAWTQSTLGHHSTVGVNKNVFGGNVNSAMTCQFCDDSAIVWNSATTYFAIGGVQRGEGRLASSSRLVGLCLLAIAQLSKRYKTIQPNCHERLNSLRCTELTVLQTTLAV